MGTNDEIIWKGTDYKNREVVLTVTQRDHIIDNHYAMSMNFHAIYGTVESPDTVYTSRDFANREVYYGENKGASYEAKGLKTKVIVEIGGDKGEIITAFPVKKEGGNIDAKIYPED